MGKISVVPEKSVLGIDIGNHGIRMDLYIEEYENEHMARVYDIEPNKYKSRELPEYISIWILPYDPFGQNRMVYTVKNCVEEDTQIVYNDGVKKLFLYTGGELGGSEDLKNLLHYFSKSAKENVVDPELMQLHSIVETIKGSQEMGEQYMTMQEYIEYEREEAIEEAVQTTRDAGIHKLIGALKEFQISDEQIVEKVMEKYQLSLEETQAYLN